jgi:rRNA-processing protein FCF1
VVELVVVDANGWFLPIRAGTDLQAEVGRLLPGAELRTTSSVLRELDELSARGVPNARLARELAGRVPVLRTQARGDAGVVEAGRSPGRWVLTADRELSDRLRGLGIPVLVPRDRDRLELRPAAPGEPAVPATVKNRPSLGGPSRSRRRGA